MKEKLYTIPVNEAFNSDCECPVCKMYQCLEKEAIEYTMGPSYMEDDIREMTNKSGFCAKHIKQLYGNQNRLGLALMLSTHMEKVIKDLSPMLKDVPKAPGLLKKKEEKPVTSYIKKIDTSCFVCDRIHKIFDRYLATILYLYRTEPEFQTVFKNCKGLCQPHYGRLYEVAGMELSGNIYQRFIQDLNELYLTNMKRMLEDLTWLIDKFDYRNANEPWKNSKDALPRAIAKLNSVTIDED